MPGKSRSKPEVPTDLLARLEGLLRSQQGAEAEFDEAEALETSDASMVDFEFQGTHYRATVETVPEN